MADLPDIEDLYPHTVTLKHKGSMAIVALAAVKWLEGQKMMTNQNFYLDMFYEEDKIAILFKKSKHAKAFKNFKKAIRQKALDEAT
jgi:hypothetical protein